MMMIMIMMIMIMIMTIVNVEQRPGWAEIVIMWVSPRMYIYNIYSVCIYIYNIWGWFAASLYGDTGKGLLLGLPHYLACYSRIQPFGSSNYITSAQVQTTFPKRTAPLTRTGVKKYDSRLVFEEGWQRMNENNYLAAPCFQYFPRDSWISSKSGLINTYWTWAKVNAERQKQNTYVLQVKLRGRKDQDISKRLSG